MSAIMSKSRLNYLVIGCDFLVISYKYVFKTM